VKLNYQYRGSGLWHWQPSTRDNDKLPLEFGQHGLNLRTEENHRINTGHRTAQAPPPTQVQQNHVLATHKFESKFKLSHTAKQFRPTGRNI